MSRWILLLLAACAGKPPVEAPVPPVDEVEIRIDVVGIGEPCAAGPACPTPGASLSLRNGTRPAKVRVVRVTVVGAGRRSLNLAAHEPTVFTSAGTYEPWDETIGAEDVMAIHYNLDRVDWDHFQPDAMHARPLTVVVEVDGRERVFSVATGIDDLVDD